MDIKKGLNNYSLKKLSCLADMLIDVLSDLTKNMSDTMSYESNLLLKNKGDVVELDVEVKDESNHIQSKIKDELNMAQMTRLPFIERNIELERDLVQVKVDLEKSLKWTRS